MQPESHRRDESNARAYLMALISGLSSEIASALHEPEATDLAERADKLLQAIEQSDLRSFGLWQRAVHGYESLACAVANARNTRSRVARSYESMEELHGDAAAQCGGHSPHAVWDAHEHGRRRQLEAALAECHQCESALLLNSGTSAVAVILAAMKLSRGATLLTGRRGHYETAEYLRRFVAPLGVKIVRVPPGNPGTVLDALRTLRPEVALFETAVNAPMGDVPAAAPRWFEASPDTLFVVDNTVQSVLTRWFADDLRDGAAGSLVVLESATKYLANHCSAGLIYGPHALVGRMRDLARATGQQLQEKAFNFLRPAEITHLPWKLLRHARNARIFIEELSAVPGIEAQTLDASADEETRALLFRQGPAGIVFVRIRARGDAEPRHRDLLSAWQTEARRQGSWIPVRAGFGWKDTTAFLHEPSRGRPEAGPAHLRASVGIEPEAVARRLARALATACAERAREASW